MKQILFLFYLSAQLDLSLSLSLQIKYGIGVDFPLLPWDETDSPILYMGDWEHFFSWRS